MTRSTRWRAVAVLALGALIPIGGGCTQAAMSADPAPTVAGLSTCPLDSLPAEAADTVRRIHSGGPFPFPRNDGVVFGNRERHLPDHGRGFYREYTVITPGAHDRSTKRIITGGAPVTDPPQYFYTGDHYDSFCTVADAERSR